MNGADLIAQILIKEGVEYLPAFPHSDLIDACAKVGIRPIIVRQERQALHIADGFARAAGGKRLCATTVQWGPGSENAMGGVAQCFADNVPVLHLPGGYLRSEQGVGPNFSAVRNMQHINKWCEFVHNAERIPQMLQNAFALLRNGRPGPVTLEVPHDIFEEDVDENFLNAYKPQRHSAPCASAAEMEEIVDLLLQAKAPVIVAGQGILYAEASEELVAFAEAAQVPVMATLNGKSAFPENHPLYLGCAACSRPDSVNEFLDQADLILGIGTSFTRSDYITPFPVKGRKFVQLTNWEGDISKDYPVNVGVIGDAKSTLKEMMPLVRQRFKNNSPHAGIEEKIASAKQKFLSQWLPLLESEETPINPYRVVWDVMHAVDRNNTIITHDAGSPRDQVTAFYEATKPHGYLGWGKTTQLGMGLGLVQGAKLARPECACINIMGDAAIGMVAMDFETGVRNKIGTTSIVLKNSVMGGYVNYHPAAAEKYAIHELGGDYAGVAKELGGYAETITSPDEVKLALKRALAKNAEGIPALLQVISADESRMAKNLPKSL